MLTLIILGIICFSQKCCLHQGGQSGPGLTGQLVGNWVTGMNAYTSIYWHIDWFNWSITGQWQLLLLPKVPIQGVKAKFGKMPLFY